MRAQRDDAPVHARKQGKPPLGLLVGVAVVVALGWALFGQQLGAALSHPGQWLSSMRINGHPLMGETSAPTAAPIPNAPAPTPTTPTATPAPSAAAHREFQQESVKSIQTSAPSR
jgi:hypothetical protein